MKKAFIFALVLLGLVLALAGVLVLSGLRCCDMSDDAGSANIAVRGLSENEAALAATPDRISLYGVPLGCPLVAGLGCGSGAKPAMETIEHHSAVAGAWLNHAGTTLAVLWNENSDATQRVEAAAAAFQNHELTARELVGASRETALRDFLSGSGWYRTAVLDRLSTQEADIVAARWVGKISAIIPLPQKTREALHGKLAQILRRKFIGQ